MGCGSSSEGQINRSSSNYQSYQGYGSDYTNYGYYNNYFQNKHSHPADNSENPDYYEEWNNYNTNTQYYNKGGLYQGVQEYQQGYDAYMEWGKQQKALTEQKKNNHLNQLADQDRQSYENLIKEGRENDKKRKQKLTVKRKQRRKARESEKKADNKKITKIDVSLDEDTPDDGREAPTEVADILPPARARRLSTDVTDEDDDSDTDERTLDEPDSTADEEPEKGKFSRIVGIAMILNSNFKSPAMSQGALNVRVLDTRKNKTTDFLSKRPKFDGKFVDAEFPKNVALEQYADKYDWKRPQELFPSENICLFDAGGASVDDIDQGTFGSCYLLSVLSGLTQNPECMKQILPPDAYDPKSGIFRCRFWIFGFWQDIYIDDYLPCSDGALVGCKSYNYKGEMWISLLEKAYAKFQGSYPKMEGGSPRVAFIHLTGGWGEWLGLSKFPDKFDKTKTYERIKNALDFGAVITCSTKPSTAALGNEIEKNGLVLKHAYTLLAAMEIKKKTQKKKIKLVKLRNPWAHQEWTGAFSDSSKDWGLVSEKVRSALVVAKDEGEFWIPLDHFWKYFTDINICSTTPDFDKDGISDALDEVSVIYGEWEVPETSGGWRRLGKNPHYLLNVPKRDDEPFCMVFELHKKIKIDKKELNTNLIVMDENNDQVGDHSLTYSSGNPTTFYLTMKPGQSYALTPATFDPDKSAEFMIRCFSKHPVTIKPHHLKFVKV